MLELTSPEKHISQRRKLERKQDIEGDSVMHLTLMTGLYLKDPVIL